MSLEKAILEAVRALPAEKQQKVLNHAARLRDEARKKSPFRSVKGLWADLDISLSAEEIEANKREMWRNFPEERHLMPAVVVDTHAIVWYLSADPRLSANAADALDSATAAGERIHVPSICLVELTYLVEKGRLPSAARDRLIDALDDPATPCLLAPLDRAVSNAV